MLKKIISVCLRKAIKNLRFISTDLYISLYSKYLKMIGIQFTGDEKKIKFIDASVYFDGSDYTLISLGDNVTISKEVMILTHDYSITTALCSIGKKILRNQGELYFLKKVSIGNDTFIGARASLLPGAKVGNNCIIGACAVVKGEVPDNSIAIGNPLKIIGCTTDYANLHLDLKDYKVEI